MASEPGRIITPQRSSRLPRFIPIATPPPKYTERAAPELTDATRGLTAKMQPRSDIVQKRLSAANVESIVKALPSPPIVQVITDSPLKESRTLLDATEQPLRRSPGTPDEELWPTLEPVKLHSTSDSTPSPSEHMRTNPSYLALKVAHASHTHLLNAQATDTTSPTVDVNQDPSPPADKLNNSQDATQTKPQLTITASEMQNSSPLVDEWRPGSPFIDNPAPESPPIDGVAANDNPIRTSSDKSVRFLRVPKGGSSSPISSTPGVFCKPTKRSVRHVDVLEASRMPLMVSTPGRPRSGIPLPARILSTPASSPQKLTSSLNKLQRSPPMSREAVEAAAIASAREAGIEAANVNIAEAQRELQPLDEPYLTTRKGSESTRKGFESTRSTKRQSVPTAGLAISDFGPTLKIYEGADQIIMGNNEEHQAAAAKKDNHKSVNLHRVIVTSEAHRLSEAKGHSDRNRSSTLKSRYVETLDVSLSPRGIAKLQEPRPSMSDSEGTLNHRGPADALALLEGSNCNAACEPGRFALFGNYDDESASDGSDELKKAAGKTSFDQQSWKAAAVLGATQEELGRQNSPTRSPPPPPVPRKDPKMNSLPSRSNLRPLQQSPTIAEFPQRSSSFIGRTPSRISRPPSISMPILVEREGRSGTKSKVSDGLANTKQQRPPSRTRRVVSRLGGLFRPSESIPPVPAIPDKLKKETSKASKTRIPSSSFLRSSKDKTPRSKVLTISSPSPLIKSAELPDLTTMTDNELRNVVVSTEATFALVTKARNMPDSVDKERVLHISAILLNAVTSAREAHKAMTEAESAAKQARLSYDLTQRSMEELTRMMPGVLKTIDAGTPKK